MSTKIVLITGASSGIGLSICRHLLEREENIYLIATSRNPKKLSLEFNNKNIQIENVNLNNIKEIKKLIIKIINKFGRIDFIINNAGISEISKIENLNENVFDNLIEINLKAPFWIIKESIPYMKKNNFGKIINISSQAGIIGEKFNSLYSASKFAIIGMTQSLAQELAGYNISINAICPGAIDTPMIHKAIEKYAILENTDYTTFKNILINQIPEKRLGNPDEVAELVLFLLNDKTKYITGGSFGITGGKTMF